MTRITIHPWGTFDVDPATGMPALPVDMFWRVKRVLFGEFWEVQLRKRGVFWSYKIEERVFKEQPIFVRENILLGAAACLERYNANQAILHRAKGEPVGKTLLGDYPPKRLS